MSTAILTLRMARSRESLNRTINSSLHIRRTVGIYFLFFIHQNAFHNILSMFDNRFYTVWYFQVSYFSISRLKRNKSSRSYTNFILFIKCIKHCL